MARSQRRTFGKVSFEGASNGTVSVMQEDSNGNALYVRGSGVPSSGSAGYAVGCILNRTGGASGLYVNAGTSTSCSFVPFTSSGSSTAAFAVTQAIDVVTSGGSTTETITVPCDPNSDYVLGQYSVTNDTDTIAEMTITANNTVTYVASADPSTAHTGTALIFRQGGVPAYDCIFAGSATSAGGDATETVTLTGALATDRVLVTVTDDGTNDVTIASAKMTANTLTVVLSGDPGTDLTFDYAVFRQAGVTTPSHYVAAMGQYTAVAGDTTTVGPFTASGALTTDKLILIHATSDDTDTIKAASISAADAITLTVSADPVTDHSYTWAAIRAY